MKIRITGTGCFGAKGEIEVGTEFEVKSAPKGWEGRYIVLGAGGNPVNPNPQPKQEAKPAAKQPVTNPAIEDEVSKMSDEELAEMYKTAKGKEPHPNAKRETIEAAVREALK